MKNLATQLFGAIKNIHTVPRCGHLLISNPFVKDEHFSRSVISIIDHSPAQGTTGVVLNHPSEYLLSDLLTGIDPAYDQTVYCGGPDGLDRMFFVHTLGTDIVPDSRPLPNGLFVGGDFDTIIQYINSGYSAEGSIRFFIGYCTWLPGQLEDELEQGTFAQATPPLSAPSMLTDSDNRQWHRAIHRLDSRYRGWNLMPPATYYN